MSQRLLQIDVFSRQPFRGNPAAVCLLSEARDEHDLSGRGDMCYFRGAKGDYLWLEI